MPSVDIFVPNLGDVHDTHLILSAMNSALPLNRMPGPKEGV